MKKPLGRRLVRWTLIGLAAAFLVSALPVVAMRWMDPWYSAFMLDAALDARDDGRARYRTDYRWVDLEQISPHAAVAVIASEDQLFPFHTGFDFKSIREAVRHNEKQATRKRPHIHGASTISRIGAVEICVSASKYLAASSSSPKKSSRTGSGIPAGK